MTADTFPQSMVDDAVPLVELPASDCRGAVAIQTHGCKLNQADSSLLARRFRQAGYRVVESAAQADIYVLNTCTVTAAADAKARQALRAARRSNPNAVVVAAGCYPQRAAEALSRLPAVSLVVPNTDKERLVELAVAAHLGDGQEGWGGRAAGSEAAPSRAVSGSLPGRSRAMIKIQEGCDQVCAYCIVPKVRGRERSIAPDVVVQQVRREVAQGCQEVVLTGTQLGTYGFDLAEVGLPGLLRRILEETDIPRLRVSSLQPQEFSIPLLELWLADRRLCPHFHLPLQSGSDTILKAMRRRYSVTGFAAAVGRIRQALPDAGITADVIVGFPGEGEPEFADSLAFAEAMGFSDMHVFPYSKRPGTAAAYLNAPVSEAVKRERMARMLEVARRSFARFRQNQLGQTRPTLWEPPRHGGRMNARRGLTDNYIRVHCPPEVQTAGLANAILPTRLVALAESSVLGVPLPGAAGSRAGKDPSGL